MLCGFLVPPVLDQPGSPAVRVVQRSLRMCRVVRILLSHSVMAQSYARISRKGNVKQVVSAQRVHTDAVAFWPQGESVDHMGITPRPAPIARKLEKKAAPLRASSGGGATMVICICSWMSCPMLFQTICPMHHQSCWISTVVLMHPLPRRLTGADGGWLHLWTWSATPSWMLASLRCVRPLRGVSLKHVALLLPCHVPLKVELERSSQGHPLSEVRSHREVYQDWPAKICSELLRTTSLRTMLLLCNTGVTSVGWHACVRTRWGVCTGMILMKSRCILREVGWTSTTMHVCFLVLAKRLNGSRHNIIEFQSLPHMRCGHVHNTEEWTRSVTRYPTFEEAEYTPSLVYTIAVVCTAWSVRNGYRIQPIPRLPPVCQSGDLRPLLDFWGSWATFSHDGYHGFTSGS